MFCALPSLQLPTTAIDTAFQIVKRLWFSLCFRARSFIVTFMAGESIYQRRPYCAADFEITPAHFGKRIHCGGCGKEFRALTPAPVPPPPPARPPEFDFGNDEFQRRPKQVRRKSFVPTIIGLMIVACLTVYLVGKIKRAVNNQGSMDDRWTAEVKRYIAK